MQDIDFMNKKQRFLGEKYPVGSDEPARRPLAEDCAQSYPQGALQHDPT
jgi:hypothetical protein